MDAVEFLKEYKRMCESNSCFPQINLPGANFESKVAEIEQWSKEHPVKTRQSEFLKMFPNVGMVEGVVHISPCTIDNSIWENCNKCTRHEKCSDCRRDYWLQEVE